MKHRLTVGVLKPDPGWIILLKQLGVSFEEIKTVGDMRPDHYSTIVINRPLNDEIFQALDEYVKRGGSMLDQGFFHMKSGVSRLGRSRVRSLPPERGEPLFRSVWMLDIFEQAYRDRGQGLFNGTVSLYRLGEGNVAMVGLDVNRLFTDTRAGRKQFYSPSGPFPNEKVGTVSKGEARKLIESVLKQLHFRRNLPYVHKWMFPDELRNIFCFRLDTDGAPAPKMTEWYEIAERKKIKITWFIHGQPMGRHLKLLTEMKNQEFALHGYYHRTYTTVDDNMMNITLNRRQLDSEGIPYAGFCAPYGYWNESLAKAVDAHELSYSSEFSLDYDTFPSYTWLGDRFSKAMQVPVHPICVGNFIHAGYRPEAIIEYYKFIIEKKIFHREPVILYDHPLHSYQCVTDEIFGIARKSELENFGFYDYAEWWGRREKAAFSAFVSRDGAIETETTGWDAALRLCVAEEKREAFINEGVIASAGNLPWKDLPEEGFIIPETLEQTRKYNLSMLKASILGLRRLIKK